MGADAEAVRGHEQELLARVSGFCGVMRRSVVFVGSASGVAQRRTSVARDTDYHIYNGVRVVGRDCTGVVLGSLTLFVMHAPIAQRNHPWGTVACPCDVCAC